MTHPSSLDLEAFVVGEALPEGFGEHLGACAECSAFVDGLRGMVERAPSRSAKEADAAIARALLREPAGSDVKQASTSARGERKRKAWLWGSSVLAPLAAAAALFLFSSSPAHAPTHGDPGPSAPAPVRTDRILMGTIPGAAEPDTQFKGGMQVAVVRDRAGQQTRFSGPIAVKPGDRLRVEVALDHEQAILAGVLADDGSYLEIMPAAVRGPGTHFSERSAKIDANGGRPTRGTILIGSPEAVARARATKQLDGVVTVRVESEPEQP
jgi:hypothetical protein